jgi:membrane fusion protein (multidrug efflux system)
VGDRQLEGNGTAQREGGRPGRVHRRCLPRDPVQGTVESLSPGHGRAFALLPPDNASGNFTKVVQRVPVRIAVPEMDAAHPLRPGMSVDVTIRVK